MKMKKEGRSDVGRQIAATIGTTEPVTVWTLADYLVRQDSRGRIILTGAAFFSLGINNP